MHRTQFKKINVLQFSNISWIYCHYESLNVDSFTYHSYEFELSNRFSALNDLSSVLSVDSYFCPKACSTPIFKLNKPRLIDDPVKSNELIKVNQVKSVSNSSIFIRKKLNFRILLINCQGITNKRSSLKECVDYIKPDAIIRCESWLSSDYTNSDSFPCGYLTNVFRKDRNKNGGGVFISVHECQTDIEIDNNNSNCEVTWSDVQTQGKPITIGAYYRPPSAKESSLKDLACSMQGIKNKQNKHIDLGGDIRLPHINWKKKSIKAVSSQHIQHQ